MDKTPLSTAKRKRKAVQEMSVFLVFATGCFLSTGWHLWLGYVGGPNIRHPYLSSPIRSRMDHPFEFWSYLGFNVVVGLLFVALGIWRYYKTLHAARLLRKSL